LTVRWDKRWLPVPIGVIVAAGLWAGLARLDTHARRSGVAGGGARSAARLNVAEADGLPVDSWTARFREREEKGDWAGLDDDLDIIRRRDPDLHARYQLGYLQARAKLGMGDLDGGRKALEPFLAAGHPFRDLALYYAAQAAQAQGRKDEAARLRETVVVEYPKGTYRLSALDELMAYLSERGDAQALADLGTRVAGTLDAAVQREMESRVIAARAAKGDEAAVQDGLRFLRGGNLGDDAAERVASALDRPEWRDRFAAEDAVLIGESLRNARHFDRAIELLERALSQLPDKRDDLLFSIGRAYFGSERYAEAEKAYLAGARDARDGETRANFLYNAARCAQLLGDDKRAEGYLTRAIVPGGKTTRASSALTQRLRIRVKQHRFAEAQMDLRAVQSRFATAHAVVEATLAYAIGMIGAGRPDPALRELERIKPRLLEKKDVPEIQYWKARAVEARDPRLASRVYLKVLRADTPTHFAFFARHRLAEGPLATRVRNEARARSAEVQRLLGAGRIEEARAVQTDAVLLAPPDQEAAELARLAEIYRRLDAYREVLELPPPEYPRFPLFPAEGESEPGRLDLLLAMGLFDDGADLILTRYPLHPLPPGVARAEALRRAQASRASIYAAEVVAREEVPEDYVPQLLPRLVRELLYPRYYYDVILAESRKHGADPRLVLSIMREESRFNPRAKSAAAARGLLQFIITTAREVGQAIGLVQVSPEDLYDPRVVIQLGAKYIADLLGQFERNGYKAAAAYNAGPNQTRLWSRMAPAPGNDMFLSAINFDETKDYVRKVLNSYERYGEIYENHPPTGGVRPEP
jgi:soluble lytic murein transglycosylase-like protein/Tfp pilus assembly protein PilF